MSKELQTIDELAKAFLDLDAAAHKRILEWAWDRYITCPGNAVDGIVRGLRRVSFIGSAGYQRWQASTRANR